jgi:hypothetical protein
LPAQPVEPEIFPRSCDGAYSSSIG